MKTATLSTVKPMKLMTAQVDIEKAITSIATRGKNLDNDIQLCALSVLAHLNEHGDPSLLNRLYNALPKGSRKAAMSAWVMTYGKVKPNEQPLTKKESPFLYNKEGETDLDGATSKPWFEFKKDSTPEEVFNLDASLQSLVKRLENAHKGGKQITLGEGTRTALRLIQGFVEPSSAVTK